MLSEPQEDELWRNWLSAEIRADYFSDLSRRYASWHSWLVWLTLFSSAGTVVAIIGNLPSGYGWVKPASALLTTALSLLSIVMQAPKKSSECADLRLRWNQLAWEYQSLWNHADSDDAESQFAALVKKETEISKASLAIPNRPRIVEKWERHVVAQRTQAS
jgi:hypothetical protein